MDVRSMHWRRTRLVRQAFVKGRRMRNQTLDRHLWTVSCKSIKVVASNFYSKMLPTCNNATTPKHLEDCMSI